jgi:hypothetical protein
MRMEGKGREEVEAGEEGRKRCRLDGEEGGREGGREGGEGI